MADKVLYNAGKSSFVACAILGGCVIGAYTGTLVTPGVGTAFGYLVGAVTGFLIGFKLCIKWF